MVLEAIQEINLYIESIEPNPCCQLCGNVLIQHDNVIRPVIDEFYEKKYFSIRRLKCENCRKIHRELPNFMVPFKRYRIEVIQQAIEKKKVIPGMDSLFANWRDWFKKVKSKLISSLHSIALKTVIDIEHLVSILTKETLIIDVEDGSWLANLVHCIVNAQMWVSTLTA